MEKRICACVNYTTVKSIIDTRNSDLKNRKMNFSAIFETTFDCAEKLKFK